MLSRQALPLYVSCLLMDMIAVVALIGMPAPGDVIQACVERTTGEARAVDTAGACRPNERPLSWNRPGRAGQQGPAGPMGPAGPAGPRGASLPGRAAVHDVYDDVFWLPMTLTPVMRCDLPAGSYAITGTVLVGDLGFEPSAVFCAISTGTGPLVFSGVRLEPEVPQTEGRFSGTTLALSLATTLTAPGAVDVVCNGGGDWVEVEMRQLAAVPVDDVVVE